MNRLANMTHIGLLALLLTAASSLAWAGMPSNKKPTHAITVSSSHANEKAAKELLKRRTTLVKEAAVANQEIIKTLENLKKNNKRAAYKTLADASGKLDIVLARDPELKLAPIGVRTHIVTLAANSKDIKQAVAQARSQLDAGHVQAARALLKPLVSEIRISTDYLPMETYPVAIKRAVTEIQKGKLKDAKLDLYAALNTIVTNDDIIPLPPLNAQSDVLQAQRLAKQDRSKNKKQIVSLLDAADQQLTLANRLGYGKYKDIKSEIVSVKHKIKDNSSASNLFGRLKHLFQEVRSKV
jgi:hypothetical protein